MFNYRQDVLIKCLYSAVDIERTKKQLYKHVDFFKPHRISLHQTNSTVVSIACS